MEFGEIKWAAITCRIFSNSEYTNSLTFVFHQKILTILLLEKCFLVYCSALHMCCCTEFRVPEVQGLVLYVGPPKSNGGAYFQRGKYLPDCPDKVMTSVGGPES